MIACRFARYAFFGLLIAGPALLSAAAAQETPDAAQPPAASKAAPAAKKAVFKGIVQDDTLRPLAGATVTVVHLGELEADGEPPQPPAGGPGRMAFRMMRQGPRDAGVSPAFFTAQTGDDGAFSLEAEGDGPFNLRVDAPGFAPTVVEKVKPGEGVSSLYLKKGVTAKGYVADRKNGTPLPDAEIVAVPEDPSGFRDPADPLRFGATARSQRDGSFLVQNLAPGYYAFRAHAKGRALAEQGEQPVGDATARPVLLYMEPGFDLSGRVLDPAGKPVPNLDLRVRPSSRGPGAALRMLRRGAGPLRVRTDKEGKFLLRGLPAEGAFTIEASPREFAPASVVIPPPRGAVLVPGLEVRLEKGTTLRARLVDAEEKPVARGADLLLSYRDLKTRRQIRTVGRDSSEVKSDASGNLVLDRLPAGLVNLTLSVEGFKEIERKDVRLGLDGKPADLGTIVLDRGRAIQGRVVDPEGKPVAAARVFASSFSPGRGMQGAEARTDSSGAFTVSGLEEGEFTIEASARGFASARLEEIATGGDPITIELPRAGAIKGRLVAGDPPRAVTQFRIEANPRSSGSFGGGIRFQFPAGGGARPRTDPRGQFSLEGLTPGGYTVTLRADGMQERIQDGVEVRPGETTDLGDVALEPGGTVRGRVQSKPDSLPVPGAAVRVKSAGLFDFRGMFAREGTVLSDLSGRFEIRGLPSGSTTLVVEPEGWAKTEVKGITVEAGRESEEIVVSVGKGGRIEGRVIGPDGRPRTGALVTAMGGLADMSAQLTATTDEQGRYAIENVAAGSYRVASLPFGGDEDEDEGAGPRARLGGLDALSAEVKDGETSIVNFGDKKIRVTGTLKRKAGETGGQLLVFASPGRGARMSAKTATTDDAGRFEVTLSESGEYTVYVGDQGMRGGAAMSVAIPDKPEVSQDLVFPEGAISGRVLDADQAKPLKGVDVTVQRAGESQVGLGRRGGARATTGEDGSYRVDGLAPGAYDVSYSLDGYAAEIRQGLEIKGTDELSGLDQFLSAGLAHRVRVVSPSGSSVPGAMVMVARGGVPLPGTAGMTRGDGAVELKEFKAGLYSFVALTRDHAPGVARDVDLGGEDSPDTTTIALGEGGSARIIVRDSGKKPVEGVDISLESQEGPEVQWALDLATALRGQQARTGGDGAALIEHLLPGKYLVHIEAKDKKLTKSLTVEDQARAELAITLD